MPEAFSDAWYIIANPTAGNHTARRKLSVIQKQLSASGITFELVETQYQKEAIQLVQQATQKGFRKIMAIGGDGTNNEVINGILNQTITPSHEITYCLLPVGTGNDWIKEYKIPTPIEKWIAALSSSTIFLQDIGKVSFFKNGKQQQRYFANVAGMAYDPFVLSEMEKLKRPITNRLAYLAYGMYYVFKYKLQRARVSFNNSSVENYFYLINAGICRYSGGGMQLVPHAIPDDGHLALTLAGPLSKLGVILNSYRFYNGSIGAHPKVDTFSTKHIKVEAIDDPILVEVDGEVLGETPVEFSIIPKALKIVVPT